MKPSLIILFLITTLINNIYCQDEDQSQSQNQTPLIKTNNNNNDNNNNNLNNNVITPLSTGLESGLIENDNLSSDTDEIAGGDPGVWSSIGMIAIVICGCICLERLYSSCKKVYQKRTGRYGFSRLQNQTFNEFEDDDDDIDDIDDDSD
eukprot:49550_1